MTTSHSRIGRAFILAASAGVFVAGSALNGRAEKSIEAAVVPIASIAAVVPGQASEYGTIKGRVVWGGDKAPAQPPRFPVGKADKDPEFCGAKTAIPDEEVVVDPKTLGVKDVMVYLNKPSGKNPEAEKALLAAHPVVVLDQKNCVYIPHVAVVHKDQEVEFKSSDPVLHNVKLSAFKNAEFNQAITSTASIKKKFEPENTVINVGCSIHGWMNAFIKVVDHPFFAVTDKDGNFEIKGVPAGSQAIVLWQTKGYVLKEMAPGRRINVAAGQTTDLGEIKLDTAKFLKK